MANKSIRRGTFETNSSSNHSLHLSNGRKPNRNMTIVPDSAGLITITGGQYGHGSGEKYNDPLNKANYLATGIATGGGYTEEAQSSAFQIKHPESMELLLEAIKEHTGATDVIFEPRSSSMFIDHQSQQAWETFIKESKEVQDSYDPEYTYQEVVDSVNWFHNMGKPKEIKEIFKDFIFDSEAYLLSDYG